MTDTYAPHTPPPSEPPARKQGLSGWRLALALFAAWVVGVVSMVAFAFAVDAIAPEDPLTPDERERLEQIDEMFTGNGQ